MIVLVTGPPGAGKSFYALRQLGVALDAGKPVATNVELAPGAARLVARSNPFRIILGRTARAERRIAAHTLVSDSLQDLFRARLRGRGEGRGVMVLDEAHYWLNARNWSKDDREAVVTFFTQHRKLGWDVYLIVQDAEMIDKQVRALIEYHVILRNLKRVKLLGFRVVPCNLFLALWTWHGMRGSVVRREVYRLSWHRKLYETHQLHHGLDGEGGADVLWLPREPVEAPGESAGRTESAPAGDASSRRRWLRRARSDGPDYAAELDPRAGAAGALGRPNHAAPGRSSADVAAPAAHAPASDVAADVETDPSVPAVEPVAGAGVSNSRSGLSCETPSGGPGDHR